MTRLPIATAPKNQQIWLFAQGICPAVWEWDADNNRWGRGNGLYWSEGEYGPQEWAPVVPELLDALEAAYGCMNLLGDILNNMDAVMEEDEEAVTPAFNKVRAALAKADGVTP